MKGSNLIAAPDMKRWWLNSNSGHTVYTTLTFVTSNICLECKLPCLLSCAVHKQNHNRDDYRETGKGAQRQIGYPAGHERKLIIMFPWHWTAIVRMVWLVDTSDVVIPRKLTTRSLICYCPLLKFTNFSCYVRLESQLSTTLSLEDGFFIICVLPFIAKRSGVFKKK